jgi:hypothetical protein
MVKVLKLPVPASQDADEHARADTQRSQRLFDWADAVLKRLRLDKAMAAARSIEELRSVTFDADSAEVILAIRDALHPASGHPQEHFRGLKEGGLKQILKNRFNEWKKTREATLRRRKQPDWTDRLILDKHGKIIANLANLILILREASAWKGVLGYDEFNARVVIRKRPPWGEEMPDAPWTDLTNPWREYGFKIRKSVHRLVTLGEQCRPRPDTTHSTRCATISTRSFGMKFRDWTRGSSLISTPRTASTSARSGLDI